VAYKIGGESSGFVRKLSEVQVEQLIEKRDNEGLLKVKSGDRKKRRERRDVSDGT
jgi:hypothetical protein